MSRARSMQSQKTSCSSRHQRRQGQTSRHFSTSLRRRSLELRLTLSQMLTTTKKDSHLAETRRLRKIVLSGLRQGKESNVDVDLLLKVKMELYFDKIIDLKLKRLAKPKFKHDFPQFNDPTLFGAGSLPIEPRDNEECSISESQ